MSGAVSAAAFIARFIAEVIHVVADLFCKERRRKEGKSIPPPPNERVKTENGRVRRVIRFFYRTVFTPHLTTLFVSRLAPLPFFFSRLILDSPNYSPGYTFSGFHGAAVRAG